MATTPSTTPTTSALARLEAVFTSAVRDRNRLWSDYVQPANSMASPKPISNRDKLLIQADDLRVADKARADADAAAQAVDAAFAALVEAADKHLGDVRRIYSESSDYTRYLAELQALSPLVAIMAEDTARAKLDSALADGRLPAARALADLITARWGEYPSVQTRLLLISASQAATPKPEADAAAFRADVGTALRNWQAARSLLAVRLADLLDSVGGYRPITDYRAGLFSPDFIFKGSPFFIG